MYALALLIVGQIAPAYDQQQIAPPYQPFQFPPEAEVHTTDCGKKIGIVPEELVTEDGFKVEVKTVMISQCGMGCCLAPVQRAMQVPTKVITNTPTPIDQLEYVFNEAGLNSDDILYDIGCGDGRAPILAVKVFGCRAVGIDRRPEAIKLSKENAELNDIWKGINWHPYDIFNTELTKPTVIYCYLTKDVTAQVFLRVMDHPTMRIFISYKHPLPNEAKRSGELFKVGDFYIWTKEPKRIAQYSRPVSRGRT